MVKCGKSLNALCSRIVPVIFAAYGLNRISGEVRDQFGTVDKIVSIVNFFFKKAPLRLQIYETLDLNIPLPLEPVIVRYCTWINATIYYCKHYEKKL